MQEKLLLLEALLWFFRYFTFLFYILTLNTDLACKEVLDDADITTDQFIQLRAKRDNIKQFSYRLRKTVLNCLILSRLDLS
jgi:hypothetical protein